MTDEVDAAANTNNANENEGVSSAKIRKTCQEQGEEVSKSGEIRKIEIGRIAYRIGMEWELLGIALGYLQNQLEHLREIFPQKPVYRNFIMLWKWYRTVLEHSERDHDSIRQFLSKAFVETGEDSLAEEISSLHKDIPNEVQKKIERVIFDQCEEKDLRELTQSNVYDTPYHPYLSLLEKQEWSSLKAMVNRIKFMALDSGILPRAAHVSSDQIYLYRGSFSEGTGNMTKSGEIDAGEIGSLIGDEWQMLGIFLGFLPNQLCELQDVSPQKPVYRNFLMLRHWYLKAFDHAKGNCDIVRQYLSKAFLETGNNSIAEKISNQHQVIPKELEEKIETIHFYEVEKEDTIHSILLSWIKADGFFFETEACRFALNILEKEGNVTIIGAPGDGKSAIGIHLALAYYQRGYKIYKAHSADDVIKSHKNIYQQVFLIDDPLGVHFINDAKLMAWTDLNDEILAFIENGKTKIIATVRKNIMNSCRQQIKKTVLGRSHVLVDLAEIHFTPEEKEGILLKQVGRKIDPDDMNHLIEPTYYPAFPLLCHCIAIGSMDVSKYSANQKPTSIILTLIEELQEKDTGRSQYCALVMVAMHDGKFDPQDLDYFEESTNRVKMTKIIQLCGLDCNPQSLDQLRRDFTKLLGIYITETEQGVEFLHERINSAVAYHFGSCHLMFVLKNCSSVFIRDMIRSENASLSGDWSNEDESNLVVRVDTRHYKTFAVRLIADIRNGNIVDVFLNPSLQDDRFQAVLAEQLLELLDLKTLLSLLPQDRFEEKSRRHGKTSLDFGVLTCTPFHWICKLGLYNLYKALLVNIPDREAFVRNIPGHTDPLHFAAGFGHIDIVKDLVGMHVDVNSRSNLRCDENSVGAYYSQFTPIFYAARQNHLEVVEFLLQSGAKPDMVRDYGASPMLLAADRGHSRVIECLLKYRADPNICCSHGTSPLYIASQEGHQDAVRVLVEGGAEINYQNPKKKGLYPLYIAVMNGHYRTAKFLLEKGANPNLPDSDGNTSLHIAASSDKADMTKLLLDYGGDPTLQNNEKETPTSLSSESISLQELFSMAENMISEVI